MALDGGKLICLSDDGVSPPLQANTISARGKTFKFGYYTDCDVVLDHPDALGLHCTIDCDAFGRVTIENQCQEHPIKLDGKAVSKTRPLLHNTEICILGRKFRWQFARKHQPVAFQMEDLTDFSTPSKPIKQAEQAPNSEPNRRWRYPFYKRLTIHSFAYCIKPGECPQDVEISRDENQPINVYETTAEVKSMQEKNKRRSSSLPPDLIDLKTPKIRRPSYPDGPKTPLSVCKLSETVITSYSPRETGVRPEKSFAEVRSSAATPTKSLSLTDISLGPFPHLPSPLTKNNQRPSMFLIDLTTPKKLVPSQASPSRTLLKSTLKKNLPKALPPQQQAVCTPEKVASSSDSSVYSIHSTDEDSVIELSDEGSFSPSPVLKTPPRSRTPGSLMKRAILSSAKKAAISKRFEQAATAPPLTPKTPKVTPKTNVRFQSQSTPQRKSLGRLQSSREGLMSSHSSAGKPGKSMITSTPFRRDGSICKAARRSSVSGSPSTSLPCLKSSSRTSLMLKQALSKNSQTAQSAQVRKSISFFGTTKSPHKPLPKSRKSVSFLDHIEHSQSKAEGDDQKIAEPDDKTITNSRKDATFSPEKEKCTSESATNQAEVKCLVSLPVIDSFVQETPVAKKDAIKTLSKDVPKKTDEPSAAPPQLNVTFSPEKDSSTDPELIFKQGNDATESIPETPQSTKGRPKHIKSNLLDSLKNLHPIEDAFEDDDLEGLDTIFKTPKAKNLMILSSPKSVVLQKSTNDSTQLVHSAEFDLSSNLEDIFKTPQSELLTNRVELSSSSKDNDQITHLSPEEAFDKLVGRPTNTKSYSRKSTAPKQELSPLKMPKDPTFPKTDIEEWIENVQEFSEAEQDEEEISFLRATQGDLSVDPLAMSTLRPGSVSTTNKKKTKMMSPVEEAAITMIDDDEEDNDDSKCPLKDPLEMTAASVKTEDKSISIISPKRPISPNISGIDLLDHTSDSLFSETLAVSDESSAKETEKTIELNETDADATISAENGGTVTSPGKSRADLEIEFEHFGERGLLVAKRLVSTPDPKKTITKALSKHTETRSENQIQKQFTFFKTDGGEQISKSLISSSMGREGTSQMGTVSKSEHDKLIKVEAGMELIFENFEEEPEFTQERFYKIDEQTIKDDEGTVESSFVSEVNICQREMQQTFENNEEGTDLVAEKEHQELKVAFENFEEEPTFSQERVAKTPEPKKSSLKEHRRTMGSSLVKGVTLELQAAKEQHELKMAFENFEEEPAFSQERVAKTPEPKKNFLKEHRRTMGSSLVKGVTLDLQAAKEQRELEMAFENFEEEPAFSQERVAKTPEPKKSSLKEHRRTMGSALVTEVKIDLQAAKEQRELEMAFENFEEEPEFTQQRVVKTPEPKKSSLKDHRRTMGSSLVKGVTLDLQAAKEQRELEMAFENFEEEPAFSEERVAKTPEPRKSSLKEHRRTMGSALVTEFKIDLQAAKEQRELEEAFENFEEEPEFTQERVVKTPEPRKISLKEQRRTMGSSLVKGVTLDLQAAKEQRELEMAFENFEEEPAFSQERVAKTPEPKKSSLKEHRRTMGSALVTEVKLDLQAAKEQRELDMAFENFEEEPEFTQQRVVKTPEPKKSSLKDHRRTMGSSLVKGVTLDLQAAKEQRELEMAFENFEEEPAFSEERVAKTPEPRKSSLKEHRRTMGSALVTEVKLDLQAAKEQRELEKVFENFEEEPQFTQERVVKTPETKKRSLKEHRRTMGSTLFTDVKFDLQGAKEQRELEMAFENFEEEPAFSQERVVKTPEPRKSSLKEHRRTMGSSLVKGVTLDLQAAKEQRELEMAFENFEEEPAFTQERVVKTPEPKKRSLKEHRRTMGSSLVKGVTFDLQAAKEQRDLEMAFENFEEEPEFSLERVAKTPEPKKRSLKEHRRTMGSTLVKQVTLDLVAEKEHRELEMAFENFEEEPEFSLERVAKTPEPKKRSLKEHRRTMGSTLVTEVTLDLQAVKEQRELEMAFENFEEEPEFSQISVVKTPEPKKENFEEEPLFNQERDVKTPEPKKISRMDHRDTMGSTPVREVKIDCQQAKEYREIELAKFEEESRVGLMRVVQTPDPKNEPKRTLRLSLGYRKLADESLDVIALKSSANSSHRKANEVLAEQNDEASEVADDNKFENERNVDEILVGDAANKRTRTRITRQSSVDAQKTNPSKRKTAPRKDAKRKIPQENETKTKDDQFSENDDLTNIAPEESKATTRNIDYDVQSKHELPLANPILTSNVCDETDENICLIKASVEIDTQVVNRNMDETLKETNDELLEIPSQNTTVNIDKSEENTEKVNLEKVIHTDRDLVEACSSNALKEETQLQISGEATLNKRTRTRNRRQITIDVQKKVPSNKITVSQVKPEISEEGEPKSRKEKSLLKDEERMPITRKLDLDSSVVNETKTETKCRKVDREGEKIPKLPLEDLSSVAESSEANTQGAERNKDKVWADEIKTEKASENANEITSKNTSQKRTNLDDEESDSDEVIHSTPAPMSTSGRRPTRKVQRTEHSASATRRGRRGIAKDESHINPVPSKTLGNAAVAKIEPGESAEEADVEEVVTSSPEPVKKRGRRVLPAPKSANSVTENKINISEKVCDVKVVVTEIKSEEIDDHNENFNMESVVTNVEEVLPSPATLKTRGRMPALSKKINQRLGESGSPGVQLSNVTTSRTRNRRAVVKEESAHATTENTTPARARLRKGAGEQICVESSPLVRNKEDLLEVSVKQEIEILPSAPLEEADDTADETEGIKQTEENIDTNVSASISKARGRQIKVEPTTKPVGARKRGRKRADEKEEPEDTGDNSKLLPQKRTRCSSFSSSDQIERVSNTPAQKLSKRNQKKAVTLTKANNSETKEDESQPADAKLGKHEPASEFSTPIRRGRRRKDDLTYSATCEAGSEIKDNIPMIEEKHTKSATKTPESSENEVASTPVPSKTRLLSTHQLTEIGASAQKKDDDHKESDVSSSKARGRRAAAMKSESHTSKDQISLPISRRGAVEKVPQVADDENVIKKAGSSKTKTALVDSKSLTESSINTSRGETSGHESEAHTEEPALKNKKTRGRPTKSKAKLQSENDSPVRKKGRKVASSKDADTDKRLSSNKIEISVLSQSLAESSVKTVENESAEHDDGLHTQNTVTPKRRGRHAVAKLESNGSAVSNPSPVRRRGRRVAQVDKAEELKKIETEVSDAEEVFLLGKIQSGGRKRDIKQKFNSAAEESVQSTNKTTVNDGRLQKPTETVADITPIKEVSRPIRTRRASAKETPSIPQGHLDVKPVKKLTRSHKNPSLTSPSQAISEDKENQLSNSTEIEEPEPAQSKSIRGRRAPTKQDATEKSAPKSDEQQPAPVGRTRTARGKKPVAVEEISSENDNNEEKTHKQINSALVDEKQVIDQPKTRSIRGRKGQQPKIDTQMVSEEIHDSPAPNKATRGRKVQPAKALKTSEDEQSQPETQQKSTRLRKAQDQIINEELTSSGRKRRKPNILLSGEFVH